MQLHDNFNLTPFRTGLGFCQDAEGRELALGLLKATFHFERDGQVSRAPREASLPIFTRDLFFGDPAASSLRYASDVVPTKRGLDIAVLGHAYGAGAKVIEAGFRVGACTKSLTVFGSRFWSGRKPAKIAGPLPFSELPLRYEHAFGGSGVDEAGHPLCFDENPIGVGFAREARPEAPLPNFEYGSTVIRSIADRPAPAGLCFIPTGWKQRAAFAGTFDAVWEKSRRPLFPADFDERFYNAVPQDQVLSAGLAGGEAVVLRRIDRRSDTVSFSLPELRFSAAFRTRDGAQEVMMKADTLLIEPDEERFAICFRASCPLGDGVASLRSVTFTSVDR